MDNIKTYVFLTVLLFQTLPQIHCFVSFRKARDCSAEFVFTSFNRISFSDCAEECTRRQQCLAVNYFRRTQACHLVGNSSTAIDFPDFAGAPCVTWVDKGKPYNRFPFVNRTEVAGCVNESCQFGEVCTRGAHQLTTCTREECNLPTNISNGHLWTNVNRVGSKAMFSCHDGYHGMDIIDGPVKCGTDGNWTIKRFACFKDCQGPLVVDNATPLFTPNTSAVNSTIPYNCSIGYSSTSPITVTCLPDILTFTGQWSEPSSNCTKQCSPPLISGPHFLLNNTNSTFPLNNTNSAFYPNGYQIKYECYPGYSPAGIQTINCTSEGVWAPVANCTLAVVCSSSLYVPDLTYGLCYMIYYSFVSVAERIANIFDGSLIDLSTSQNISLAEYLMIKNELYSLYVGTYADYKASTLANWADGHPNDHYDCVVMSRGYNVSTWSTISCYTNLSYIILE